LGKFDNLNDSHVPDLIRRIERLERASPMNNAAIGRGGIEVYDGGVINVSNGGLNVTGTATITGTLQADGTIAFTGTLTQTGESTFTGPTHLDGPTDTTGTLSVEGVTTLKNDLNVTAGGKIKAGGLTLDPSVSSGALVFSNGAQVFTDATTVQMFKGTSAVQVANGTATLQGNGSNYVRSDTTGNTIAGPLKNTSASTISSVTANVYMDSSGNIKRIV
jgi:hypothetical protein